ncbi:MAG: 4-hydroxy-3-methylbut-2-enyl diphosphate reductase [Deltaproteobacteria bacterium]|nr:4-hydroxy-3-methylbut-2-enyl diphosphate reductase [Deltaproteobacteria bacterium]
MKVKLAKTAGFCMGVRRALDLVLKEAGHTEKPLYTFGPLIHNPQVLELLKNRGVEPVETLDEIKGGTVFIRAHGVPPEIKKGIEERGARVIDATCPHVLRAQMILDKYAKRGYKGVISGDPNHPEVVGLLGFTHAKGLVVQSKEELRSLAPTEKVVIVAQTTQHHEQFDDLVQFAESYFHEVKVERTICGATRERQAEVSSMAPHVDGMVVVGGYNSGNTRRLARIARESGVETFHVETDEELEPEKLSHLNVVGVTAGASTPNWMIKKVIQKLQNMRGSTESAWRSQGFRFLKFVLQSNLYVALCGAGLTYASMTAQGLTSSPAKLRLMLISFLFLYSLHIINHLLDRDAGQFNDPERIRFFNRYKFWFVISGGVAQLAVVWMAYRLGMAVLAAALLVMIGGLLYSVLPVPRALRRSIPYRRFKDIPGSKSVSIALGWGVVTTFLPALTTGFPDPAAFVSAFTVVVGLVLVRSAFFELLDVQGDMIVGKETLPVLLGEQKTLHILNMILVLLAALLIGFALLGWGRGLPVIFGFCCPYTLTYLWLFGKRKFTPGPAFELTVESNFVLAGIVAYLFNSGLFG